MKSRELETMPVPSVNERFQIDCRKLPRAFAMKLGPNCG